MVETLESNEIPEKLIDRDIIFFDGSCVLCHKFVKTVLKYDTDKHFLLCSQQSDLGHLILQRHGIDVDDLSSVYVVTACGTAGEGVLSKSNAAVYVLRHTRERAWMGTLLALVPSPLRDLGYGIVAKIRYRVFGQTNEACSIPSPEDRARIIG